MGCLFSSTLLPLCRGGISNLYTSGEGWISCVAGLDEVLKISIPMFLSGVDANFL
jgi:hypothetical protein